MKITASEINLFSKRVYFQKDDVSIEKQMKFYDLLGEKIERVVQGGTREPLGGISNGNPSNFLLSEDQTGANFCKEFLAEIDKLRQILYEILIKFKAGAMKEGSLMIGAFEKVKFNLFAPRLGTLVECEYREEYTYNHHESENTDFFANGKVIANDGKSMDFSFKMDMSREFFKQDQFAHVEKGYVLVDPLVLHLGTTAPKLLEAKVSLDLNLDGKKEDISVPGQGSGFLVLDINQDGIINDGRELFGPSTGEGFQELSKYDKDGNSWIDENDKIYEDLSFWASDEKGEMQLKKISDVGIGAIYLASVDTPFDLRGENNDLQAKIKKSGIALNEDGSISSIQEIDWA